MISIKLRTKQLAVEQRADVLALFNQLVNDSLETLQVTVSDFLTAARMADHHSTGLRAGDALHLAVAFGHGARLCTLDRKLAEAALSVGVSVLLL